MIKLFRVVLFIVCVLGTSPVMGADAAAGSGAAQTENFDWEPVIKAIVQVESEGNTRAVKGNSCGAMPILV